MIPGEKNNPVEIVAEIEALYIRVLDLARRQESSLRSGDLAAIPSLLTEKLHAVSKAQDLTRALREDGSVDKQAPLFQQALTRVAALLSETVKVEDGCRTLTPSASQTPPRQHAIAAYSKARAQHRPGP